jgi:GxxExxY protein
MTQKTKLAHHELTAEIIGSFFTVYNVHGFGFLESVYVNSLSLELRTRGLRVEREVPVEVQYLGQPVGNYRLDMVVNGLVVVEIKAGATLVEADRKQLFNYLKASRLEVGLLLHFGPAPEFKRLVIQSRSAVPASSASSA